MRPPCTHREEHPIRSCEYCGAYLRSYREGTTCDPCGKPAWELDEAEVWGVLARAGLYERKLAADAFQELVHA